MNESIDTSLTSSIATTSLADIFGSVSETAIDSVLESGALRDIPIIGMITGTLKAGNDIKSALFIRKIAIFFKTLSDTSDEDRRRFIDKFRTREEQHRFGEAILLLLERAENMEKPKLIAQIINAYISNKVDESMAFRICSMIDRCYVQDFELLRDFVNGTQGENILIVESLLSVGFLSNAGIDGGTFGEEGEDSDGVIYNINDYGKIFVECVYQNG